jgi:hypothetical protein
MLRLRSLLLPLLLLLAACGLDETYTGMGEGALPGDPLHPSTSQECNTDCPACECNCTGGGPADDVAGGDAGTLDVEDLTGAAWRIGEMTFTAPLTGLFGDELNGVIADEIAAGNINVILHVTGDDRESKVLGLEVGAAEAVGKEYSFSETPADMSCTLVGQQFTTDETGALTVPTDLMDPPALPINRLLLSGTISMDGASIAAGVIDGVLTGEDAALIKIAGVALGDMLVGLQVPPDLDLDDDGTPESWRFLGDWSAVQVDLAD